MILGTYFHSQNVDKHKKGKTVTLSFPKFVDFYHVSVPGELKISETLFTIYLTKILINNRKRVFYLYQKQKR